MNRPGVARTSAVAASTGWLKPRMEPNALTGSPSSARCAATASVSAEAAPQGLLCLMTDAAAAGSERAMRQRGIQIQQIVVRQLLAVQLPRRDQARTAAAGERYKAAR